MPDIPQVEKSLVDAAQRALLEVREGLPKQANGKPAGWQTVATEINSAIPHRSDHISKETARNLGDHASGGRKAVDAVVTYMASKGRPLDVPSALHRFTVRTERYPEVEAAFTNARRAGVSDAVLDLAREYVGALKSETGPTRAEVEAKIAEASREIRRLSSLYGVAPDRSGEATDLDDMPPVRKESGVDVKRQRSVDVSGRRASMKR